MGLIHCIPLIAERDCKCSCTRFQGRYNKKLGLINCFCTPCTLQRFGDSNIFSDHIAVVKCSSLTFSIPSKCTAKTVVLFGNTLAICVLKVQLSRSLSNYYSIRQFLFLPVQSMLSLLFFLALDPGE